ncbi:DUF4424 family protein [Roseivivax sp. CAU 1753]
MRSMFMAAACGLLGLPVAVTANDSAAVLEAGGLRLVRDVPVEIVSEELYLSPSKIDVSYVFRAADDIGFSTLVAFPLPEYDLAWLGESVLGGAGDTVQSRSAFRVWVDGAEIVPQLEVKAMRNGIDVTQFLQNYDVPIGSLDYDAITASLRALPQNARQWAEKADIVRWYDGTEPEPRWTIKAAYFWAEDFPPGQSVHVRHSYVPIAGQFFVYDPASGEIDPADHCMTEAEQAGLRNRIAASQMGAVVATQVRYVLTTGANWQGPIGSFKLIVDKEDPANMVSLCVDGLKKTAPTRFEKTVRDFVPRGDIDALFISALQ